MRVCRGLPSLENWRARALLCSLGCFFACAGAGCVACCPLLSLLPRGSRPCSSGWSVVVCAFPPRCAAVVCGVGAPLRAVAARALAACLLLGLGSGWLATGTPEIYKLRGGTSWRASPGNPAATLPSPIAHIRRTGVRSGMRGCWFGRGLCSSSSAARGVTWNSFSQPCRIARGSSAQPFAETEIDDRERGRRNASAQVRRASVALPWRNHWRAHRRNRRDQTLPARKAATGIERGRIALGEVNAIGEAGAAHGRLGGLQHFFGNVEAVKLGLRIGARHGNQISAGAAAHFQDAAAGLLSPIPRSGRSRPSR